MLITIFGESCTGKSTLAEHIKKKLDAVVFTGKDYLRLEKNEAAARTAFIKLLSEAVCGRNLVYVISETEQLSLIPNGAVRILATADLETIKSRFSQRMHGNLPDPVARMLEKKHGCFDNEPFDFHYVSETTNPEEICGYLFNNP